MPERTDSTEHDHRRVLRALPRPRLLATLDRLSPYWGPQLVVLVAIVLDLILPNQLTLGVHWLLPSIEGALLIGLAGVSPHPAVRHHPVRRQVALGMIGLVSAVNIYSLVRLCDQPDQRCFHQRAQPDRLGRGAVADQRAPVRPLVLGP